MDLNDPIPHVDGGSGHAVSADDEFNPVASVAGRDSEEDGGLAVLDRRVEGAPLPFEDAREQLLLRWRAEQAREAQGRAVEALKPNYEVIIE